MRPRLLTFSGFFFALIPLSSLAAHAGNADDGVTMEFRVHQADRNQDNKLTFEEFVELRKPFIRTQFQRLDRNSDGSLSEKEMFPNKATAKSASGRRPARSNREEKWSKRRFLKDGNLGSDSD